jgi:hypothetical protein
MSLWLNQALSESRARDMREAAARYRARTARTPSGPGPGHERAPRAGLRGRLGYALVEAGLRMLATAGPPGGSGA